MPVPLVKVVVATPVQVPFTRAKTWPLVAAKSEEVEMAVGTARAPVELAQSVLAAIEAKEMDAAEPPTWEPSVPELVRPVPTESAEVATDWYTPAPPPYRSWEEGAVVVPVPPLRMATVPVTFAAVPPMFKDEVAAKASAVPAEFEYSRLFAVKEVMPVPPEVTGSVPEMVARVVEATQVGRPLESAKTKPLVVNGVPTMVEAESA